MASNNFVSRGGDKLQAALDEFKVNPKDKIVLDVGSSTGGFVDCLLQNGASKVYALDTAYGELAWKLRNDSRVVVMERTNILHLKSLPENADLITIDAGWTKLELILPIVKTFLKNLRNKFARPCDLQGASLKSGGEIIALLKPQYESQKEDLVKGVLPVQLAEKIKDEMIKKIERLGFTVKAFMESPILGGAGNKEYLLLITCVQSVL